MAKGSALVTVGLAVGAAWYLRNVAFPGTSSLLPARFADASRPRLAAAPGRSRAAKTLPPRCSGTRRETWLLQTHQRARARHIAARTANLPHTKAKHKKPTRNHAGKFGAKEEAMSSEEILARYDNYYSGATDWDTAQQPAHDEHNNAAAAAEGRISRFRQLRLHRFRRHRYHATT